MAIDFDAATQASGSTNSLSWSHACTGDDRALLVGLIEAID